MLLSPRARCRIRLMKIYFSHAGSYDYKKDLYEPIKNSSLNEQNEFFLPHEPGNIGTRTEDIIKNSDLLIAEVSRPSTGQGIELGWASAHHQPIACIYRIGTHHSNSLSFICTEFVAYQNDTDLITALETLISRFRAKIPNKR